MKRGKILLFVLILSSIIILPLIFSAEQDHAQEGYDCLEEIIDERGCGSLTLEEQVFSLLAIKTCQDEIENSMSSSNCWPDSGCDIKSTAQAIFALSERNQDTKDAQDWLLTQTKAAEGLEWFLEIETSSPSVCTSKYRGEVHEFSIDEKRKLSGNAGDCLVLITGNPYWYRVNPGCFEEEFRITCDEGFLTTLLFREQGSSTINVLDDIHSAAAHGETSETVSARCFTNSGSCTYQGTLWATLALWAEGQDVKPYIPYLTAMKDVNERFLPESFLYFLTGKFLQDLLSKQKYNSYWEISGNRYYDTALALWPLKYDTSFQKTYAKDWLLTNQESSGCWHGENIVDTAFILRSVWPEFAPECRTNNDCPDNYNCNITTMTCYFTGTTPPGGCENDDDCPVQGEICNTYTGECYNPGTNGCENDDDCPVQGEICDTLTGECYNPSTVECGNDEKEAGEHCDGIDLDDKTCSDILDGEWTGTLSCIPAGSNNECRFDTSDCSQITPPGGCENDDECLGTQKCDLSTGECYNPSTIECGNDKKEAGEQCDGTDLNGESCSSILDGDWSGTLSCISTGFNKCKFDTSDCSQSSNKCTDDDECPGDKVCNSEGHCVNPGTTVKCSNGLKEEGEQCDGKDFNGQTCETILGAGWTGNLKCTNNCLIDTSNCEDGKCTWNYQCPGSQICDGGTCVNPPPSGCTSDNDCLTTQKCDLDSGDCIPKDLKCTNDYECPGDKLCENGECIEPEPNTCTWNYQCPGVQLCINNTCQDPANITPECISDEDCNINMTNSTNSTDMVCEGGFCINQSDIICINDYDCPGSDVCDDGTCVSPSIICFNDYDCPGLQECVAGNCLEPSPNKSNKVNCTIDFDCPGNQVCVDGICSDNAPKEDCLEKGYFCMSSANCQGNIYPSYECFFPYQCCDTEMPLESCFQQSGEICSSNQECVGGTEVTASDLNSGELCCTGGGYCLQRKQGINCTTDNDCYIDEECVDGKCVLAQDFCEDNGGNCRVGLCNDDERESYIYSCEYGDTCCILDKESGKGKVWLVIILFILIALVVVGIIFRDKLKVYWLKVKSKFDKGNKKPPYGRRPPKKPKKNNKFKEFINKLKEFFTGKKKPKTTMGGVQQRPLRGPLAVQHAQRQAQFNKPANFQSKNPPIKPGPAKSTKTVFADSGNPKVKLSKKKVPEKPELDEVLEKLKKMSNDK